MIKRGSEKPLVPDAALFFFLRLLFTLIEQVIERDKREKIRVQRRYPRISRPVVSVSNDSLAAKTCPIAAALVADFALASLLPSNFG